MKLRRIIVLSLLLALCVGYVVVSQWDRLFSAAGLSDKRYVFGRPANRLTSLTIQPADGRRVSLHRTGGEWWLTEPIAARADKVLVGQIAEAIRELRFSRRIPQNGPGAGNNYGLASPAWRIHAVDEDGREMDLLVGAQAPAIGARQVKTYVRPAGQMDAYVVDVDFAALLDRPAVAFRDKQLLAIPAESVIRLSVEGDRRYTLQRSGGGWELALSPERTVPADEDAALALVTRVAMLRASGFADAAAPGADLTESNAALTLTLSYWDPLYDSALPQETILLGRAGEQGVCARLVGEDTVFLIDAGAAAKLQPDSTSLRRRQLMDLRPADVSQVTIDSPDGGVLLVRAGARWRMLQPFATPADEESVERLLYTLSTMHATAFHDQTPAAVLGLAEPSASITLDLSTGEQVLVTVGSPAPDAAGTFVRAGGESPAATVSAAVADVLLNGPGHYITRKIGAIPPDAKVISLVLVRPDGTFAVELDDSGHWQMLAPTTGRADDEVVERIASRIKNLRAEKIVSWSDRLPNIYRTDLSSAVITAVAIDPSSSAEVNEPTTYVLRVVRLYDKWSGRSIGDFAWEHGARPPIVGKVDKSVYRDLMADLTWRRLWDIDTASVQQIRIAQGGDKPIVLQRDGDHWVVADDPYARVDVAAVGKYLDGIRQLEADEYLADSVAHLDRFGLHTPWLTVELTDGDGEVRRIAVADHGPDESTQVRYATASGVDVVMLISTDTVGKLAMPGEKFLAN